MNLRIIFVSLLLAISMTYTGYTQDEPPVLSGIRGSYLILNGGMDSMKLKGLESSNHQLIFCMFHAEEDPIGLDPGLSTDGRWRAINLLKILKDLEFKAFFTTPFRNNILTLQPLTDFKGIELTYYDQADLISLYNQVEYQNPGNLLMMIHHSTFPKIFKHFTGKDLMEDVSLEPANRIYIIHRSPKSNPEFFIFRYNIR